MQQVDPHLVMDGSLLGRAVDLISVRAQAPVRNVVVYRVIEEDHVLRHLQSVQIVRSGTCR